MVLKTIKRILPALAVLGLSSCYYDAEDKLYVENACDTADMSLKTDIEPIISSNCYVCHSADANLGDVTLEGYDNLKKYVDNGSLIGSINHNSGYSPMPEGGSKMASCNLAKIEAWVAQGALNN